MAGRSRQELIKRVDRLFIPSAGEMSDEALYREFLPAARNGSGEGTVEFLRERLRQGNGLFLPQLAERRRVVEMMNRRFPAERDAILATAERAAQGRLDLLGYSDLAFGSPIDWHLDPLSGAHAPMVHWSRIDSVKPIDGGDLKVFWEIQRTAHFVAFGQAWWLTEDHQHVEQFVTQALSWIEANPAGMGIGWAASLDVSFRAIAWVWAIHLCAGSRELTPGALARMVKSLIEHGCHIEKYLSHYFSPNTHLTGEALGLFYLGVAFPELRRAEKWRRLGLQILLEQLPRHVREDGVYFEQASYYHRYTADFYTHLFALIRANDVAVAREDEQLLWRKLEALQLHLMWISRPDGTWPLVSDDDGGRLIKFAPRASNDFRDTLAMGAAIFKRGDFKRIAGEAPAEMLWLLGPEAIACYDRVQAETPKGLSHAFESSGFHVIRDGWEKDSSFCLIDGGPLGSELGGPGHAHSDGLAIELALDGTTWLVDPATFVYGANPEMRDWFRSTKAHNTATVDDENQSVIAGAFAWETMADCQPLAFEDREDHAVFTASTDGYERLDDPVTHTRSVLMLRRKGVVIVSDSFAAEAAHKYAIHYHFAPGCEARVVDNRVEARSPAGSGAGRNLAISFFTRGNEITGGAVRIEKGWVSTCYGQRVEAPMAVFEASCVGPVEITSVIASYSHSQDEGRHSSGDTIAQNEM
ncbi:MAG: alginate lyase family protein [Blastocatellia bacterium]|nr:alginate lyase family protein [Blastocatellia bacterium]